MLFGAIFAGLYIPYALTEKRRKGEVYDHVVTKRMDQFKETINWMLAERDGVCVYEGPFPYSTRDERRSFGCNRCEDLYQAGLVTKSVSSYEEFGREKFDARFELTALGRSVYAEDINHLGKRVNARFCFGRTALHKIVEVLPPMNLGGATLVGVKYVAEVLEPHPFLFDPQSEPLRLAVPQRGERLLYPPRVTTLAVQHDGTVDISHIKYGKYVNE